MAEMPPTAAELLGEDEVEVVGTATTIPDEIVSEAAEPIELAKAKVKRAPRVPTPVEAVEEIQSDEGPTYDSILTPAEIEAAKAEARERLTKEQRSTAKKRIIEEEMQRLRVAGGMTTGDAAKDQLVKVALDLAPHSPFIVFNHRPYYHNQTYTVPRHVAESLREVQQNGWRHQDEIDGKTLTEHYQRQRSTGLSPVKGVTNAPQAVAV